MKLHKTFSMLAAIIFAPATLACPAPDFYLRPSPVSERTFHPNRRLAGFIEDMRREQPEIIERYERLQHEAYENWGDILSDRAEPLHIAVVIPAYIGEKERILAQNSIAIKLEQINQLLAMDAKGLVRVTVYVVDDKPPAGLAEVVERQIGLADIPGSEGCITCKYLSLQDAIDEGWANTGECVKASMQGLVSSERPHNIKWGAVKYGMAQAVDDGADIVCMTDPDSSQCLTELPNFLTPLLSGGYSASVGSRFVRGSAAQRPTTHNYAELFLYAPLVQICMPRAGSVSDVLSGFKAFRADALRNTLPGIKTHDFSTDAEMLFLISENGGRIKEVPRSELNQDETTTVDSAAHIRRIVDKLKIQLREHGKDIPDSQTARSLIAAVRNVDAEGLRSQQKDLEKIIRRIGSGAININQARQEAAAVMGGAVLMPNLFGSVPDSPFTIQGTTECSNGAIRLIKTGFKRNERIAQGYVIFIKPGQLEAGVWVDREMVDYDLSRFAMTDALVASKRAAGQDVKKKDLPGKTVPRFFADAGHELGGVDIAMAATQGGFWGDNTFVIINGRLIRKEVSGLYPPSYPAAHQPVTGEFFFFVLDEGKVGVRRVYIENDEAKDDISDIGCAFCGPPMLLDGVDVSGGIKYIKNADGSPAPLRTAYQVNWEPGALISQFSAWGRGPDGEIVYMGFVGNPENPMEQPGIYCTELVELAGEIGITDLILGPGSVDVNVCVAGEGHILQSLPGPGSATAKAFPEGRPVGTIFWARAKTAGRSSVPGDLFKSPAGRTNDAGLSALIVQAI